VLALTMALCVTSAFSSLGLLIGIYFARFDWDHPKRMLSSTGGLLLSLACNSDWRAYYWHLPDWLSATVFF